MPLPEPTAEELTYGRHWARVHGVCFASEQFAAGYALGRRRAETAPLSPDVPPPPPPPAGRRTEPALTAEQQIRIAALTFAASITQHADGMSFRDVEQTSIGMADRAAGWIATGAYDWFTPDPTGVEFGPGVACSCGPDSVTHVHEDPWGCTTCGCRFYVAFEADVAPKTELVYAEDVASIARTMEGIRFTPVDIPLADAETVGEASVTTDLDTCIAETAATNPEFRTALAANLNALDQAAAEYIAASPEERAAAVRADRLAKETGDA